MRFNERIKVVTVEGSTKKNNSNRMNQMCSTRALSTHMCSKLVGIAAFISFRYVFYCYDRTYNLTCVCMCVFVRAYE